MAKDHRAWTFGDLFHNNRWALDLGHEIFAWPRIRQSKHLGILSITRSLVSQLQIRSK
jgi:hypothetical protein